MGEWSKVTAAAGVSVTTGNSSTGPVGAFESAKISSFMSEIQMIAEEEALTLETQFLALVDGLEVIAISATASIEEISEKWRNEIWTRISKNSQSQIETHLHSLVLGL